MDNQPIPTSRVLVFYGGISEKATTNLRAALLTMQNEGAEEVTILFASYGGNTDDGIALYTFLKALSLRITMHAVGVVSSIAVQIFLAVPIERRIASEHARFFFHQTTYTFGHSGPVAYTSVAESDILLRDATDWQRSITKRNTKLVDADFERLKLFQYPVLINPSAALEAGIVSAIAEPKIPLGCEPRVVEVV